LVLKYNPAEQAYRLIPSVETPLLDLPAEDLTTLAWLQKTFDELSPQHESIQALLDRLIAWLPPERREAIERQRLDLQLDLARRDDNHIPAEVKSGLARALSRRVRVEFDYLASTNDTGQPRRHIVDPYAYFFHDGHYYLKGYCHSVSSEEWQISPGAYNAYRLDRMTGLTVEGTKLPPTPPRAKKYKVIYRLDPRLARGGISRQRWIDFTNPDDIERHADDSVIVHGVTDDLFFAVQALMHYRHHCRVLGGPEILAKMRETVQKMAEIYLVG
ncbi:MAG TPA: WYL domain-containing protein, partial [Anaerolineae bacterium]|nr:WYL domain-containing protein [Anaerolineae bacterium]